MVSSDEEDSQNIDQQRTIGTHLNTDIPKNETNRQQLPQNDIMNKIHHNNLKLLRKQLSDSTTKFGVVLGAGISVNAGICAFRGSEGVFTNARKQYTRKLDGDDDEGADDILAHAFSTQCLRGDPRMQYRVLRQFEVANREKNISPTFSHVVLRNLHDRKKLVRVITQNIDSLEDKVGLGTLGDNLVYAHGRSNGPLTCINPLCPARISITKQLQDLRNINQSIKHMTTRLKFLEDNITNQSLTDTIKEINDQEVPLLSQTADSQQSTGVQLISYEGNIFEREQMRISGHGLKLERPVSLEEEIPQLKANLSLMCQRKQKVIAAIRQLPAQILFGKYCAHTSNNIQHRTNAFVPIDKCTVLQPLNVMPLYDQKVVKMALLDGAVACCTYCGAALKPSMVLYEEEVHISMEDTKRAMEGIDSLLVIGTSLNVQPVNLIPCCVPSHVDVHFLSLDIDFIRYLSEFCSNEQIVFDSLVNKKMEFAAYKHAGPRRDFILQELFNKAPSTQEAKQKVSNYMSKLSPKINFHQGDCDQILKEALKPFPELVEQCETMFNEMKLKSQIDNSHLKNYTIQNGQLTFNNDQRRPGQSQEAIATLEQPEQANRLEIFLKLINETNIVKYLEEQGEIMTFPIYNVFLAVPSLWPPDSVIYTGHNDKQGILCQCTLYQIAILRALFQNLLQITMQKDLIVFISAKQDSEKISYQPIGGHWATYLIAYNRYRIRITQNTQAQVRQLMKRQKDKQAKQQAGVAAAQGSKQRPEKPPTRPVELKSVKNDLDEHQVKQQAIQSVEKQAKPSKSRKKFESSPETSSTEPPTSYDYYEEVTQEEEQEYEEYEEFEEDDEEEESELDHITQFRVDKQSIHSNKPATSSPHVTPASKVDFSRQTEQSVSGTMQNATQQADEPDVVYSGQYCEYLDPWSTFYLPYKKKDEYYNKYPDMITFQGVAHNFREALSGRYGDIVIEKKQSYYQVPPENLYKIILQTFKALDQLK